VTVDLYDPEVKGSIRPETPAHPWLREQAPR
jgi:hypothetical protein